MNTRFREDLLLTTKTGKALYESYAKSMPIIDYHCHLQPKDILENKVFEDLGEMWLSGDHYKWRAMRTFGIDESLITGKTSYREKFMAFAEIFPQLIGNPIYIWCMLELKRFFDIDEPLCKDNAQAIYQSTYKMIHDKHMTPRMCMVMSNVKVVMTTDDPVDDLQCHKEIAQDNTFSVRVLPAFRPDRALYIEKPDFKDYIAQLEAVTNTKIDSFQKLIAALEMRLIYFKSLGAMVSDCGLESIDWKPCSLDDADAVFAMAINAAPLGKDDINRYRSVFLTAMGNAYHKHDFVMQIHAGTLKNGNTRMAKLLGADTGYDCTRDAMLVDNIAQLLDTLSLDNKLPKTILYPLNAAHSEPLAILAAAFCEGPVHGKVQLGAPWWFNDQAHGMQRQFEAVANLYPVALSVGMLTDSRSFLSYPRHELYRRIFCNYLGTLIERGEYFSDEEQLKQIIENVCYFNAKSYFGV